MLNPRVLPFSFLRNKCRFGGSVRQKQWVPGKGESQKKKKKAQIVE